MRTERERAANDAIEAAIEEYRNAYREAHPDAHWGTLTNWIVVAAETVAAEDKADDVDAYSIIMPSGGAPWYQARGLLEAGIHFLGMPDDENKW